MNISDLSNELQETLSDSAHTFQLAHITLGNLEVGVPLEQVRQVLPWPEHLHRLPRKQNEILGIFSYRNQTIPLVDLHNWLGIDKSEQKQDQQQIMILGCEGKNIAFAVDMLHGLKKFPTHTIQRIYQNNDNSDEEFFHSVIPLQDGGHFINLLDSECLIRKAQAWSNTSTTKNVSHFNKSTHHKKQRRTYITFYVGEHLLAIPTLQINEVIKKPEYQEVLGMSSSLLGMARWRNRDLPIINFSGLFHEDHNPEQHELLLVIRNELNQILGLPISKMRSVYNAENIETQETDPLIHSTIFSSTLTIEENQRLFFIDCNKLFEAVSWSAISTPPPLTPTKLEKIANHSEHNDKSSYLVFEANGEWATSVQEIRAILPLPTLKRPVKAIEGVVGCCEWRNHNVPIVDLRQKNLHGMYEKQENAQPPRLIIIKSNNRHIGFIVSNVIKLLPTQHSQHTKGRMAGSTFHVITVTQGEKRSYHVKQLSELCSLKAAS